MAKRCKTCRTGHCGCQSCSRRWSIFAEPGNTTFQLRGVELFPIGNPRGKPYDRTDLDDIVRNFKRFSAPQKQCGGGRCVFRPPVFLVPGVLGHEEEQKFLERTDLPAAGVISDLWHDGKLLYGNISGIAKPYADAIRSGAYRTVSVEIYPSLPHGCPATRRQILDLLHEDKGIDPRRALAWAKEHAVRERLQQKKEHAAGDRPYVEDMDFLIDSYLRVPLGKALRRVGYLGADLPEVKTIAELPKPEPESSPRTFAFAERPRLRLRRFSRCGPGGCEVVFSEIVMPDTKKKPECFGPEPGSNQARAMWSKASLSGAKIEKGKKKGQFSKTKMKKGTPKGGWGFSEGETMSTDEMKAELTKRGVSESVLEGLSDEQLAEWCRSLEDAQHDAVEDEVEGDDEADDMDDEPEDEPSDDMDDQGDEEDDEEEDKPKKKPAPSDDYGEKRRRGRKAVKFSEQVVRKMIAREVAKGVKSIKRETRRAKAETDRFSEVRRSAERTEAIDRFCEAQAAAGKILPRELDQDNPSNLKRRLQRADSRRVVERFSENGKTVELTEFDLQMREIEQRIPFQFGERMKDPADPLTGKPFDRKSWSERTWDRFSESFKKVGVSRQLFIETNETATDEQFADTRKQWESQRA